MRQTIACILLLGIALCPAMISAQGARPYIAAGSFYPADAKSLLEAVRTYVNAAPPRAQNERLVAMVLPHSAYQFCGEVIGRGVAELQPGQYDRVIILAPGHYSQPEGCSIPNVETYVTPLGHVFLDQNAIRTLCYSSMFSLRTLQYSGNTSHDGSLRIPLHEVEHGIEVLLPFLQERLGVFRLVPIIVGQLSKPGGGQDEARIEVVAEALRKIMDKRTLVIVSTDFTHYGNDFSYLPFMQDIERGIESLDRHAFEYLGTRDYAGFAKYLDATHNTICGATALQVLLKLLPQRVNTEVVGYLRSAQKTGNPNRSVSYAALNFYQPGTTPSEAHPERRLSWNFTAAPPSPPEATSSTAPIEGLSSAKGTSTPSPLPDSADGNHPYGEDKVGPAPDTKNEKKSRKEKKAADNAAKQPKKLAIKNKK